VADSDKHGNELISFLKSWECLCRVLRRIFGPKRDEVTEEWRKLRRMRWEGHVARMGEKRKAYRLLVGKPEGK
jgi:hypothetical protein